MIIRVISSPYPCDYDDLDYAPPWEYEEEAFIDWVDEVFCESERPDLTLDEACEIIECNKYEIEMEESGQEEPAKNPAQEMCERCKVNPANPPHTCPYQTEINGDYETECNCCDECSQECAWEV